jgi:hypothetical protein
VVTVKVSDEDLLNPAETYVGGDHLSLGSLAAV